MSKRNKLKKFAELLDFPNVFENYDPANPQLTASAGVVVEMKGNWAKTYFNNNNPVTLELACGRGEYTLELARRYPHKNFIGVDVKGARIWQGAHIALAEKLTNVCFLRTKIEQIDLFFAPNEVSEIWITFPDPFLRESKANRRLTALPFLNRYRNILQKKGLLHLKTDNSSLYEFSLEVLNEDEHCLILYHKDDIYASELFIPELDIKTYYEKMHLANGLKIKYIQFQISR